MKRKTIDPSVIKNLSDVVWLTQKLITEKYSCSRLAKELGTTRTTVEKYRIQHGIVLTLSQQDLADQTRQAKSDSDKSKIIQTRKNTNLALHGAENTFQSHAHKVTETMKSRHGVTRALQHPTFYAKRTDTMVRRHGVEHAAQSRDLYQKQMDTNISRYGTNPAKLHTFQNKAKDTNLNKYQVEHFSQKHLSIQTLTWLADPIWLVDQHHNQKKTLTQIGNELGCNITTVHRYCVTHGVEIKHYFESAAQREISDWLISLGFNVETNKRDLIRGELDIYLPDHNLAIEYCGIFWHSDAHERMTASYHLNKLKQCQDRDIRLITMFEDEWVHRKDIVKQKLCAILGVSNQSVFARKCTVSHVVDKEVKRDFFDANHIQGDGPGSITYALVYGDNLVAMMTFIKRASGRFVLNRFACNVRVVGGFQKLLKYFCTTHSYTEIVSFADLRWSEGGVYTTSGFTLDSVLPPDYRYVIGNKTYHKFAFRRRSLEKFLPNFSPDLTEVANMRIAGYYRIWNCGLLRYVLRSTV